MPRLMSFALTPRQLLSGQKSVTRRLGWANLAVGEEFVAVLKAQGLAAGETVRRLAVLRCTGNRAERLDSISAADVRREGFFALAPAEFVAMFCREMNCRPETRVRRIAFEVVELLACRVCGCTDDDACYSEQHGPCSWFEPGLCSHCAMKLPDRVCDRPNVFPPLAETSATA